MLIIDAIKFLFTKPRGHKKCTCGKFELCCRKIQSNQQGKLWVKSKDHFGCGKIQQQIKEMEKIFK